MIPPPPPPDGEIITRDALDRVEQNSAANLGAVEKRLLLELDTERKLRELTERLGGQALQKAEEFITEKTEEHNHLLSEMRLDRANFVTKQELEKEKQAQRSHVLFLISVASFLIIVINLALRWIAPTLGGP